MQLFTTSPDPRVCAEALDDKRAVNGCAETAGILKSALHLRDWAGLGDKFSHLKHPIVVWAASDTRNVAWVAEHLHYLGVEYTRRYKREHASVAGLGSLINRAAGLTDLRPKIFCNAAANRQLGLDFTHEPDVFRAYKAYLNARWARAAAEGRPPRWTSSTRPEWATAGCTH